MRASRQNTRTMKTLFALSVAFAMTCAGCSGSTRHVAIGVDYAFARAVFAFDDAEFALCQTGVLARAQCDQLNPLIRDAEISVKAATLALKALPKDGKIPTAIPDLLQSLDSVNAVLATPSQVDNPSVSALAVKLHAAVTEALNVVRVFGGFVPQGR